MESTFRLSYSEHEVAGRLQSLLREPKDRFSVTLPLSRQNKGWDLLVHSSETGRAARIQVKASRWYLEPKPEERGFSHVFWFNNFRTKLSGADFFVLFSVFPALDHKAWTGRDYAKHWEQRTMILSQDEVGTLLPPEGEKFFYLAFDADRPDEILCLNGRKQTLGRFSYAQVRSTVRVSALKGYLTDNRKASLPDNVRVAADAA